MKKKNRPQHVKVPKISALGFLGLPFRCKIHSISAPCAQHMQQKEVIKSVNCKWYNNKLSKLTTLLLYGHLDKVPNS